MDSGAQGHRCRTRPPRCLLPHESAARRVLFPLLLSCRVSFVCRPQKCFLLGIGWSCCERCAVFAVTVTVSRAGSRCHLDLCLLLSVILTLPGFSAAFSRSFPRCPTTCASRPLVAMLCDSNTGRTALYLCANNIANDSAATVRECRHDGQAQDVDIISLPRSQIRIRTHETQPYSPSTRHVSGLRRCR